MHKLFSLFVILFSIVLISGCMSSYNTSTIRNISEQKLADGTTTTIGFKKPVPEWECVELARTANNWMVTELQGTLKMGGGYELLKENAIKYANEKGLRPNYIFLYVPSQYELAGVNLSAHSKGSATYLKCKNPPAKRGLF